MMRVTIEVTEHEQPEADKSDHLTEQNTHKASDMSDNCRHTAENNDD